MDVALTVERKGGLTMKNFRKSIGGALIALAFIFGISVATSTTAQAQWRNDDNRRDRNNDGYRDRNRDGQRDRDWRRERNDNRGGRYGSNGRYGNNGTYGTYGNNGGYNNAYRIEQSQGYQAGVNTGASDAQRGQSYSPQRSHYYREARTQAFRDGFVQGYNEGFRQYGYNNGGYRRNNGSGIGSVLGTIFGRTY
jgi:hypothetical protein